MIDQSSITINENGDDHDHNPCPQSIINRSADRDPKVDNLLNDDFPSSNNYDST